jgi:hypothetical protein
MLVHPEPMSAVLTGVIGVVATLLGSISTYYFQSRTAVRAESFARDERLRQEQLTACSAYAGALTDLKRGQVTLWFHRDDPAGEKWQAARVECDQLGAAAEAARFRVRLVSPDASLMTLADAAFSASGQIRTAPDRTELMKIETRFEDAVTAFAAAAGAHLRAAA